MFKTYYELIEDSSYHFIELLDDLNDQGDLKTEDLQFFYNRLKLKNPKMASFLEQGVNPQGGTSLKNQQYASMLQILYHLYHFIKMGKRVMKLTDNLVENLMATDMGKVSANLIRLPFNNVYFSFDEKYMQIYHPETGHHKVYGIFVTQRELPEDKTHLRFLAVAKANNNSVNVLDDVVYFFQIILDRNKPIEEAVTLTGDPMDYQDDVIAQYWRQVKSMSKFIFNVVLYISSKHMRQDFPFVKNAVPTCTKKNKAKIRRFNKKYASTSRLPYYSLGDDIIISVYKNECPTGNAFDQKFHFSYRFTVRGHWRQYIETNEGKPVWIQPYHKGPTMADVVEKPYQVK